MKILGCFKIVPDLEMLSSQDWIAGENNIVDCNYVKTAWNCFDESALEMMLRLSDLSESLNIIELSALTIGKENCDPYLKVLYALGYQRAVRINCSEEIIYWPELTAAAIASYVKNCGGQDLVLMGRESADGDNSKTPLLTAELLGWPCVTQVIKLEPVDESHLKIYSTTEEGILKQVIKLPCVLAVGDAPNSYLRVPTLKDRMKSAKQAIQYFTLEDLGIDSLDEQYAPDVEAVQVTKIENDRQTIVLTGSTPQETAKELYSYLKGRLQKS